jgi:hypothetical protein
MLSCDFKLLSNHYLQTLTTRVPPLIANPPTSLIFTFYQLLLLIIIQHTHTHTHTHQITQTTENKPTREHPSHSIPSRQSLNTSTSTHSTTTDCHKLPQTSKHPLTIRRNKPITQLTNQPTNQPQGTTDTTVT